MESSQTQGLNLCLTLTGRFSTTEPLGKPSESVFSPFLLFAMFFFFFFALCNSFTGGFPGGTSGKEPTCQGRRHMRQRLGFHPWGGKSPWRRAWQPTPVILPRESHRQMSLAGYSPWGHKESDTTEATSHTHMPNTLLNPVCKFINFTLKMCL